MRTICALARSRGPAPHSPPPRALTPPLLVLALLLAVVFPASGQFRESRTVRPHPLSGNLSYQISLDLGSARATALNLPGRPEWIVAARMPAAEGGVTEEAPGDTPVVLAFVATRSGELFQVELRADGRASAVSLGYRDRDRVPAILLGEDGPVLMGEGETVPAWAGGSVPPLHFREPEGVLALSAEGAARWEGSTGESRYLHRQGLPDGLAVVSREGLLALPVLPSARYPHGILGDTLEPRELRLHLSPERYLRRVPAPVARVFETRMGVWGDSDGDGRDELLLTESSERFGARFVVYEVDGGRRAVGPANGRGYRWKHLLGTAPTGPGGETEIIGVSTPHITGVLEFYRDDGSRLVLEHSRPGFSSHRISSGNLAMAALGDFNADGKTDVLLPTRTRDSLRVIQRNETGSREVARLDLSAPVSTNIFVLEGAGRSESPPALFFGTADGAVIILTRAPEA